jgi:hypothetical protein
MNLYAKRDVRALGKFYTAHMQAMTAENLHEKSDIAAELAFRDQQIAALEDRICALESLDEDSSLMWLDSQ